MLSNYVTVAVRNLMRHKGYALINILGLAIGMGTCILIVRYIQDELSVDGWHANADRIYRVIRESKSGGQSDFQPGVDGALAGALKRDFPEVEEAVRLWGWFATFRYGDKKLELNACITDTATFRVFDFPFLKGNVETAFADPTSIAMTESAAKRLFGDEDPIGKAVTIESVHLGGERTVTALLKDIPRNSTIRFDYVATTVFREQTKHVWEDWLPTEGWRPVHAYVLLREGVDPKALEAKLPAFMERYMGPETRRANTYHLQALTRIYLHSAQDFNLDWYGDINRVYQFGAVALFVLAIGCINFVNLATARSVGRAREVGLRKVSGAQRMQLIGQFLGESVVTAFLALILATAAVKLVLPEFNAFFGKQLVFDLPGDPLLTLSLLGVAVVVGAAAGLYPAVFLSSFEPTETLKGTFRSGSRGQWLRKGLVVVQFAISIVLIVGTGVVTQQLDYIRNKKLGFSLDQMVMVPIFVTDQETKAAGQGRLAERYQTVKAAFMDHPNVLEGTAYRWWMGYGGGIIRTVRPEGQEGTEWRMPVLEVDEDYLPVFRIELTAGRNFDPAAFVTDTSSAFILNETAVRSFGWDPSTTLGTGPSTTLGTGAVGKTFAWINPDGRHREGRVVGVVRDFHYSPLREKIGPVAITLKSNQFYNLGLRVKAEGMDETLAFLEKTWKQFAAADQPFQHYFWDEQFEDMYDTERRVQTLTLLSSGMAIFLACMGLFGLASFATEQRRKEIGIRKTLGATAGGVVLLVSRDFVVLVVVAAAVASPVAWTLMRGWLEHFAYRMDLGPGVFVAGALAAVLIAQGTVTWHALRAARVDPVEALRHE